MTHSSHGSTLVLGGDDVRRLMPMRDCLPLIEQAMRAVSRGEAALPLRIGAGAPGGSLATMVMPGWLGSPRTLGAKLLTIRRDSTPSSLPSHQGIVVLFDPDSGAPMAIMDAHSITSLRTAAASALATRTLAREDAATLALLGTGEQAAAHLEAIALVRRLRSVKVWGRTAATARDFAQRESARSGLHVVAVDSAQQAVAGADIVTTTTASREPVLAGAWLATGSHVNLVGASSAQSREADDDVVRRARFFVDYRASALAQAGELLMTMGANASAHIAGEIGEVLEGRVAGRRYASEITVYKSLGIAAQDLALAHALAERAPASGSGTRLQF